MKYTPRTANTNTGSLNEIGYAPFCLPTSVFVFVTGASVETWLLPSDIPLWSPVPPGTAFIVDEEIGLPVAGSLSFCSATDKISM